MQLNTFGFTSSGDYSYRNGAPGNQLLAGYHWLRTAFSEEDSYSLHFYPTRLYPRYSFNRGYGFPLRCLAR